MSERPIDLENLGRASRRSAFASLAGILVVVASLVYSFLQLRDLDLQLAEKEGDLAEKEAQIAAASQDLAAVQREIEDLEKKRDVLVGTLSRVRDERPEVVKKAIEDTLASDPGAAETMPRVFFHIREESQRPTARELAHALEANGFLVPGIERLDVGPNTTQLKYFRPGEEKEASKIVEILRGGDLSSAEPILVAGDVRKRHYELWVSPNDL